MIKQDINDFCFKQSTGPTKKCPFYTFNPNASLQDSKQACIDSSSFTIKIIIYYTW